jgi:hypothetical protein
LTASGNFAFAYDTLNRTISGVNVYNDILFNTNALLSNWTHAGNTASFICPTNSTYEITTRLSIFSSIGNRISVARLVRQVAGNGPFTEITGSQFPVIVPGANSQQSYQIQALVVLQQNDVIKAQWASTDPSVALRTFDVVALSTTPVSASMIISEIMK